MCNWRKEGKFPSAVEKEERRLRRSHDSSALRPLNDWGVISVAILELLHFSGLELSTLLVTAALVILAIVLAIVWR